MTTPEYDPLKKTPCTALPAEDGAPDLSTASFSPHGRPALLMWESYFNAKMNELAAWRELYESLNRMYCEDFKKWLSRHDLGE